MCVKRQKIFNATRSKFIENKKLKKTIDKMCVMRQKIFNATRLKFIEILILRRNQMIKFSDMIQFHSIEIRIESNLIELKKSEIEKV
jgi:hypothetical protein